MSHRILHQRLLEQYAPPSLIIDERYDILHLSERAGKYLQLAGEPSKNLLKLIRPELRLNLSNVLFEAVERNAPVEVRGLQVPLDNLTETINILVRPVLNVSDVARGYILVLFERVSENQPTEAAVVSSDERAFSLEHGFDAEELKTSNEELETMNEELRSAAEELETSKEELQAINEQLRTVNQELKLKVEETTLANDNLQI